MEEFYENRVHLRLISQGRKKVTIIQGLKEPKSLLSKLKTTFHCSGGIVDDPNYGCIIKLTGNHTIEIKKLFVEVGIAREDQIFLHGE